MSRTWETAQIARVVINRTSRFTIHALALRLTRAGLECWRNSPDSLLAFFIASFSVRCRTALGLRASFNTAKYVSARGQSAIVASEPCQLVVPAPQILSTHRIPCSYPG